VGVRFFIIDKMIHFKHIRRSFASDFSRNAREGHPSLEIEVTEDKPNTNKFQIKCPHYDYCNVRTFGRINCMTRSTIKSCQAYKFYERYGEEGNGLGVGS